MTQGLEKVQQFLGIIGPQLGPILNRVPELVGLFRNAFRQIGGDENDLEAILAANQKNIDRLGDPDSFRQRRPPAPTTQPTPTPQPEPLPSPAVTTFPYNRELTGPHPRTLNEAKFLQSGDVIWRLGRQALYYVYPANAGNRHEAPDERGEWREDQTI